MWYGCFAVFSRGTEFNKDTTNISYVVEGLKENTKI